MPQGQARKLSGRDFLKTFGYGAVTAFPAGDPGREEALCRQLDKWIVATKHRDE